MCASMSCSAAAARGRGAGEHTYEAHAHRYLHSYPTRRSCDLEHAVGLAFVRVDPRLGNLRDDVRFNELLRRVGSWEAPHVSDAGVSVVHTTSPTQATRVAPVALKTDESDAVARRASAARDETSPRYRSRLPLVAGLGLVVLLAVGFGVWYFRQKGDERPAFQQAAASKITCAGNVRRAALSPDGKIVAYVIDEAGKQGLWVRQVAVSNSFRLVPPSDVYYRAITFSHDGTYIYYTVAAKDGPGV